MDINEILWEGYASVGDLKISVACVYNSRPFSISTHGMQCAPISQIMAMKEIWMEGEG